YRERTNSNEAKKIGSRLTSESVDVSRTPRISRCGRRSLCVDGKRGFCLARLPTKPPANYGFSAIVAAIASSRCHSIRPTAVSTTTFRLSALMQYDVFISYSQKDEAVAQVVCKTLEAQKIRCWIAPRDIPPGAVWQGAIMRGLGSSRMMVLIFSSN